MRLLLFSDLHCSTRAAHHLVEMAEQADVVIGAGDFATVRRDIDKTIDILKRISRPTLVVPGNSESPDELAAACADWDAATLLHGTGVQIDAVSFFGIGGAIPVTPFGDWSYDIDEKRAREMLAECPSNGVLISHSPPKGYVDRNQAGLSLGSTAVLETIQRVTPRLVVCGHIHESAGKRDRIGHTDVINVGPEGMLYRLE